MISVAGLEKSFGDRTLFAGASFLLNAGERYGLVGANGSGKTTLLNILAADMEASAGSVSIPRGVRLGVLRQDRFLYEDEEILPVALMGNAELWAAMAEKEKILAQSERHFDANRFSELEDVVQRHDGYMAEARAAAILEGLGIPANIHRNPLSTLSGGFRLRVLLAQVLASAPDVLLLDEPTNHLDILAIRWLEKFLRGFSGAVVVISHDHRFLDNVATHILDVDYETVLSYPGNYSRFLEAKKAERGRREKEIVARQKEIVHHQKFVDRFRAKATKARQAQSKLRLIEKKAAGLDRLPRSSRRYPAFRFEQRRPSGQEVVKVSGVAKSFGDNHVLQGVGLRVNRGDRIAIMGPNGIGKSTLLKIMMGRLEADEGSVEWGYETHPGHFAQDYGDHFRSLDRSAEAWIEDFCDGKGRGYALSRMGMVLFSGDDAEKRLGSLSGGEAARLVFCSLMIRMPNVLVLDEPTNHLDLEAIEALVEGLRGYDGTLVFVSHDRWFVSRLANRIVEITPGGIRDYRGSYEEYVHFCGDDHLDADTVVLKAKVLKAKKDKRRRARSGPGKGQATVGGRSRSGRRTGPKGGVGRPSPERGRKEMEALLGRITSRIESAEVRISEIDAVFASASYSDKARLEEIRALKLERLELVEEVARLMSEWEEVEAELAL